MEKKSNGIFSRIGLPSFQLTPDELLLNNSITNDALQANKVNALNLANIALGKGASFTPGIVSKESKKLAISGAGKLSSSLDKKRALLDKALATLNAPQQSNRQEFSNLPIQSSGLERFLNGGIFNK